MLLKKAIRIGIDNHLPSLEQKRIKILNYCCLVGLFTGVFFLTLDLATKQANIEKTSSNIFQILLYSLVFYLHYKKKHIVARFTFISLLFIIFFYNTNIGFKGFYGEYTYMVLPLFSLLLFNKKITHYSILLLSITLFYLPNIIVPVYPDAYFGYLNALFIFIGVFMIVNFFKSLNNKNETLLEIEKAKVLKDKLRLEEQQIQLEKLSDFKSHFFINLSHEIRTPLTLIKGYSNQIEKSILTTEQQEKFNIINKQSDQIQSIVDSIMDIGKIDANKLNLKTEPINVNLFLQKNYIDFKILFDAKLIDFSLELDIDLNIALHADPNLLSKSFNNLLNNAYKFTPEKGSVKIVAKQKNNDLTIAVIDSGIGIPEQDTKKVFDRFYQSPNHINKSKGSGIGLSFTQSIIQTHGFSIALTSIPNTETNFTITIPEQYLLTYTKNNTEESTPLIDDKTSPKSLSSSLAKRKILLVEDHMEMRAYITSVLTDDFDIIEAENGKTALDILEQQEFDVIVTDYMMPVMDGETFVKAVKQKNIKTPVIVLTARKDRAGKLNMLRLGIDAYLNKPFLEEELLINIKKSCDAFDIIKKTTAEMGEEEKKELDLFSKKFNEDLRNYILEHLNSPILSVDTIAEHFSVSKSTLNRKAKYLLGQTTQQIIMEVRFDKASELKEQDPFITKKAIASLIGISNGPSFFNKMESRLGKKIF